MDYKNTENKKHMMFSPEKEPLAATDFIGCFFQRKGPGKVWRSEVLFSFCLTEKKKLLVCSGHSHVVKEMTKLTKL